MLIKPLTLNIPIFSLANYYLLNWIFSLDIQFFSFYIVIIRKYLKNLSSWSSSWWHKVTNSPSVFLFFFLNIVGPNIYFCSDFCRTYSELYNKTAIVAKFYVEKSRIILQFLKYYWTPKNNRIAHQLLYTENYIEPCRIIQYHSDDFSCSNSRWNG